jgi:hypothetical protein
MYLTFPQQSGFGCILGDFFTTSSGHPGKQLCNWTKQRKPNSVFFWKGANAAEAVKAADGTRAN